MSDSGTRAPKARATILDHPVARAYLRRLDAYCASLPGPQARELHEQIAAHLEEALPPGASDQEVAAELGRLGTARSLAREAEGPLARPALTRTRRRLARVRWWTWTAIALAIAALATWLTFLLLMENATPLAPDGLTGFVYRQDAARQVSTSAGSVQQVTIPIRYGQEQGFLVSIVNTSDWTQTVLGLQDPDEVFGSLQAQVAIGIGPEVNPGLDKDVYYELPASIPPHSVRLLRVTWLSDFCASPNGVDGLSGLDLRVRVGMVTRTEEVPFVTVFGLRGTKESGVQCR